MRAHGVNAGHTPTFDDTEAYLRAHWQPGDLVLTMGCGNINQLNAVSYTHLDVYKRQDRYSVPSSDTQPCSAPTSSCRRRSHPVSTPAASAAAASSVTSSATAILK